MTDNSLDRHRERWSALPPFPAWPQSMDDEDATAWGDVIYMRALVDDIEHICTTTGLHIAAWTPEFDMDVYLELWLADFQGVAA